jgi:hypothetical protein
MLPNGFNVRSFFLDAAIHVLFMYAFVSLLFFFYSRNVIQDQLTGFVQRFFMGTENADASQRIEREKPHFKKSIGGTVSVGVSRKGKNVHVELSAEDKALSNIDAVQKQYAFPEDSLSLSSNVRLALTNAFLFTACSCAVVYTAVKWRRKVNLKRILAKNVLSLFLLGMIEFYFMKTVILKTVPVNVNDTTREVMDSFRKSFFQ